MYVVDTLRTSADYNQYSNQTNNDIAYVLDQQIIYYILRSAFYAFP